MKDVWGTMQSSASLSCFAARIEVYCASVHALAALLPLLVLVCCELVL